MRLNRFWKRETQALLVVPVNLRTMITSRNNWTQEFRYRNRGSAYLFAPMVNFNVMAEVGETPP